MSRQVVSCPSSRRVAARHAAARSVVSPACRGCRLNSGALTLPSSSPHLLAMRVDASRACFADDSLSQAAATSSAGSAKNIPLLLENDTISATKVV